VCYFGIDDDGVVYGVHLSRSDRYSPQCPVRALGGVMRSLPLARSLTRPSRRRVWSKGRDSSPRGWHR
jgi:hypothetical protein